MDSPTNLLVVVWDRLPFALAVVVIAFIGGRIAARSLDALGERINTRRLLFKQVSAITRFLVLIVATVLVAARAVLVLVRGAARGGRIRRRRDRLRLQGPPRLADGRDHPSLRPPLPGRDRISFDDTYGEVVEIGLRAVRVDPGRQPRLHPQPPLPERQRLVGERRGAPPDVRLSLLGGLQ